MESKTFTVLCGLKTPLCLSPLFCPSSFKVEPPSGSSNSLSITSLKLSISFPTPSQNSPKLSFSFSPPLGFINEFGLILPSLGDMTGFAFSPPKPDFTLPVSGQGLAMTRPISSLSSTHGSRIAVSLIALDKVSLSTVGVCGNWTPSIFESEKSPVLIFIRGLFANTLVASF
ncbi:hypothetical protein OIU74_007849 [Salix koriyanagi]|uniref:Uncharacterized protein n=1 Tax=Salix koriyanagi TaxID=2511006 RepID=A0A9Q0U4M8_9ROSI|nr:hypothetical protein OIU74_007849 [Salix koriyanagi]